MEPVRLIRWLLSPLPTFRLWRRMKLWELRSYRRVLSLEQERLVYQARLRARFGRAWRRKAPVEQRLPLKLTHYGVPLGSARALVSAPAPAPESNSLEIHIANALALASGADAVNADAGMNPRIGQAPAARPVIVNRTGGHEPGPVNWAVGRCMNTPVHAPADCTVNRARPGVKGASAVATSRMKRFTPAVNDIGVNRVNTVNPLLTGTVNGFTPIVNPCEFTREAGTVNWLEWSLKQPVELSVMHLAAREPGGVNDGVNRHAVNSHRARRPHAAKAPAPSSVHATVGAPSPEEAERAKAAADWFAAKAANPRLTQTAFVRGLGRSPSWMTKSLKEAARKAEAAADG
jgi:hypothetical protein